MAPADQPSADTSPPDCPSSPAAAPGSFAAKDEASPTPVADAASDLAAAASAIAVAASDLAVAASREESPEDPAAASVASAAATSATAVAVAGKVFNERFGKAGGTPEGSKIFIWFFMALLLFALFLLYYMLRPFLHSIILSCVFTAISLPFYHRCLRLTGNQRVLSAFIVLLCILFLVILPISIFISGLIPQAVKSVTAVNQWLAGNHLGEVMNNYIEPVLQWLHGHFPELSLTSDEIRVKIREFATVSGQYLISHASSLVGNTLMFFAHLLLVLMIMFFLLIDGPTLVRRLEYLLPLKPTQTVVVIDSLRRMARAVLVGGFCVAALQGVAGGIGFALVGIPPLFWGTLMCFAALVPVVGTGLVWVPAVIVLLAMDEWKSALFLLVWCGVGVTSIDSFLRPLMMRGGAKVPVLFIFMAILGGVNVFGMVGLLYGPMILGLVAVMIDIYQDEYQDILQSRVLTPETAHGHELQH